MITVYALANSIVSIVTEDKLSSREAIKKVKESIDKILLAYAGTLGIESIYKSVKRQFFEGRKGNQRLSVA
jgi:hypothetical protein